jgi:hypothetical protein
MARRVSGRPTALEDAKTRRCVHSASSRPPPSARDEMAEMVGISREARFLKVERSLRRKSSVLHSRVEG